MKYSKIFLFLLSVLIPFMGNSQSCSLSIQNGSFDASVSSCVLGTCTGEYEVSCVSGWELSSGAPNLNPDVHYTSPYSTSLNQNPYETKGEGIFTSYNFFANTPYKIEVILRKDGSDDEKSNLFIKAANGLSKPQMFGSCQFPDDIPSPMVEETIYATHISNLSTNFTTRIINPYTPSTDLCQFWIYLEGVDPLPLKTPVYNKTIGNAVYIDGVTITNLCEGATISSPTALDVCEGGAFSFTTDNNTVPTSTYWDFGDNTYSSLSSPTHAYNNPGNYTVTLTVVFPTGCTTKVTAPITISPFNIDISSNSSVVLCHSVNFTHTPIPSGTTISSINWDFGDGNSSTLNNPTHHYTSIGNKTVTLNIQLSNGCSLQATKGIQIDLPTLIIDSDTIVCIGNSLAFSFITNITDINAIFWNFGDGTSSNSNYPTHTYNVEGDYQLTLSILYGNGCNIVRSQTIHVEDPNLIINVANVGCINTSLNFNFFHNSSNPPSSVLWDFGDGNNSTASFTSHTYTDPGVYVVDLEVVFNQNCTVSTSKTIEIKDFFTPEINIVSSENLCLGVPATFSLEGDLDGITNIDWGFHNTVTSTVLTPTITYATQGSYIVSVTAHYSLSCAASSATDQITVYVDDFDFCSSCAECIGSFAPEAGKKYVLSAWVKEEDLLWEKASYIDAGIEFQYEGVNTVSSTFRASGPIIEGWQQIEEEFIVPEGTSAINIKLKNEGASDVYFDDVRIFPFNANLKSFVYDPITMRLTAELDENNYATFYEYDEDGNLVRVKKETDRGVKTIQETIKRFKQQP